MKEKSSIFLVGPFIGELSWEFFNFAPYIIYLKQEHPGRKIIVFTRSTRFDLYGRYADILVPFKITNDIKKNQCCFKMRKFDISHYDQLAKAYYEQYSERFEIIDHIYPNITAFYYKLKWQFPRELMKYNFKPRKRNKVICDGFVRKRNIIVDNFSFDYDNENIITIKELTSNFSTIIDDKTSSILGCLIESIRKCRLFIGNLKSDMTKLAILLKTPVLLINDNTSDDDIHLLNPCNTLIMKSDDIDKGVEFYEDYIRC